MASPSAASLIIGNERDPHVTAVAEAIHLRGGPQPLILDAPALQLGGFLVDLDRIGANERHLPVKGAGRGWLRRYAPTDWGAGSVAGSIEAATRRAFLALVGAISRLGDRQWLTPLDNMLMSEDRMVQLQQAAALGIRTPRTVVASCLDDITDSLGTDFIVKPLANGYFTVDGVPHAVFTSALSAETAAAIDFAAAPFVAQERIRAIEHLRIVTVEDGAWIASLPAAGRPLDWRSQSEAHSEWQPTKDDVAATMAVTLANSMNLGFSSQDWIRDDGGVVFVDLNPGGQWLFLPSVIAYSVTRAVADYLSGGSSGAS